MLYTVNFGTYEVNITICRILLFCIASLFYAVSFAGCACHYYYDYRKTHLNFTRLIISLLPIVNTCLAIYGYMKNNKITFSKFLIEFFKL